MGLVMKSTSEKVRQARTDKGWSQGDLARETGLTAQTISNIECGKSAGSIHALSKIAGSTGKTIDHFIGEKDG